MDVDKKNEQALSSLCELMNFLNQPRPASGCCLNGLRQLNPRHIFQDETGALFPLNRVRDPLLSDANNPKIRLVEDWLGVQASINDDGDNDASKNVEYLLLQMQDHHITVW